MGFQRTIVGPVVIGQTVKNVQIKNIGNIARRMITTEKDTFKLKNKTDGDIF